MRKDLRTGPRFFLNPPIHGSANGTPARVIDVGAKGLRIELRQRIEPGSPVEVVFKSFRIRGTVLWCQIDAMNFSSDDDYYLAGIAFDVPNEEAEDLGLNLTGRGEAVRITEMRAHDRYRITAPLTGSFGDIAPVSIVDVSIGGARIAMLQRVKAGYTQRLRFQVDDDTGPMTLEATVAWCNPSPLIREFYAGLEINGQEEKLRIAIDRLCTRDEARIDIDSLKRKFDSLRLASRVTENPQRLAV
jgi:PilZ domain-containing protein